MSIDFNKSLLCSALVALFSVSSAQAATSADLAKLGNELTPFGARKQPMPTAASRLGTAV